MSEENNIIIISRDYKADKYGLYKYQCSQHIEKDKNIINLRIFGLYGEYEDYKTRFISNAVCRSIYDLPIIIKNQNVYFDYLYMGDFLKIIDFFILHNAKHKFYNVGKGERIDLLTLANKIKRISKKEHEIVVNKKGLAREYTCDITRLKEEIKGIQFTSHDKAIKNLYGWYKNNKKNIEVDQL